MLGLTPFRLLPRTLQMVLGINLTVFLLYFFVSLVGYIPGFVFFDFLYLDPEKALGQPWRIVTYMFLHLQPFHFLFNMLLLWMFAVEVVRDMGEKTFLRFYLGAGVVAGLVSIPWYLWLGGDHAVKILGASGALFAVMYAYARLHPRQVILLFLVIPMEMRFAIWLLAAVDLLMLGSGDLVAHMTHLGGFAAAILYFRYVDPGAGSYRIVEEGPGLFARLGFGKKGRQEEEVFAQKGNESDDTFFEETESLDAILEKISKEGMESLSAKEREILAAESHKRQLRSGKIIHMDDWRKKK